ncbi:hypothetical protein H9Q70_013335 [Fusarium xylarioides]|nr:hypothetical protein H9Q70_013335 [Fusarium xylarioides]
MPIIRRSLQFDPDKPDPGKPYLTEGHDVTYKINQAIINKEDYNQLCNKAMEVVYVWEEMDDTSCIRLAAFGCKILLLVHRLYRQDPPIKKAFLIKKLKELNELKGKLLRGIHIRYEELVFIDALRDDMYDEWFEAIQDQVQRVLKKTKLQLL